jgi:glutathione S-transferase
MTAYKLYGSHASLFTGKVRAYLNWKAVPYEDCAVDEEVMKTIILPHVGWPVVPVVQTPDSRIVQDTADIIVDIEATHPTPSVMPDGPVQQFASYLMQVYADQWLVLPAMHYRWNYNEDWAYTEFGRATHPDATPQEQHAIGKKRGIRFRGMVPTLGIDAATIPGVEASYEAFLTEFAQHLGTHDFVFGGRPSFADFALFGPLYAHLYRDPESRKIMERVAPPVARWVERTLNASDRRSGLVGNDDIPATLLPMFKRHATEHLPVLQATNDMFAAWCETAVSGDLVPRAFGMVPFQVEGCDGQTVAQSFSLFRLQAALDAFDALSGDDRTKAETFLDQINAAELATFKLARRLERKNCKLCLA